MPDVIENVRNEFKVKLTDKFEKEVISFLNTNGGNIFIGVNDKRYIEVLQSAVGSLSRVYAITGENGQKISTSK